MTNRNRRAKTRRLVLEGDLTLPRAVEIKLGLLEALEENDRVLLAFGEVGEVDLSLLQLLCAASRTAEDTDRVLEPEGGSLPEPVRELAEIAGFASLSPAKAAPCGKREESP